MPESEVQQEHQLKLSVKGQEAFLKTSLPLEIQGDSIIIQACLERFSAQVGVPCVQAALNFVAARADVLAKFIHSPSPVGLVLRGGGHPSLPLEYALLEVDISHGTGCATFAEIRCRDGSLFVKYVSTERRATEKYTLLHKTARFMRSEDCDLKDATFSKQTSHLS